MLVLLMLVICGLAFMPHAPGLELRNADKLQHMAAFLSLAVCAALALPAGWRSQFAVLLLMLAFGVFIEAVQMHIPSRSADWQDVAADMAGALAGMLAVAAARRMGSAQNRTMG
jgi:VanZ family protein